MTDIGFLGLGAMGAAMARRLVQAGHQVTAWNRSAASAEALAQAGAIRATDAAEAVANPVVISMLADDAAAEGVFTAEAVGAAPEGAVHVNMASISIAAAERLQKLHEAAGVAYLAAPVLGRPPVAEAGELTIVTGGAAADLDRVRPVLDILGKRIWHVGETPSAANLVKIAVNFTIIHALQALGESVSLVEGGSVDPGIFIDILNASLFPGPVYYGYGHMIAERRYSPPGFTVPLGRKDLRLAQEAAAAHGVALSTMPALVDVFEAALTDGALAELDWAAIAEITRARSGAPELPRQVT
jgi:3-hydroxyisobutyrate dehydrogenase-like beta-hydroxyacid dehydrogenase